jgi:hypothetical protein
MTKCESCEQRPGATVVVALGEPFYVCWDCVPE